MNVVQHGNGEALVATTYEISDLEQDTSSLCTSIFTSNKINTNCNTYLIRLET